MKQCNPTTLIYIACLLVARSNAAPATSPPEPESPVFTLDLESGNAPAALQTLRQSDPPAVAAGNATQPDRHYRQAKNPCAGCMQSHRGLKNCL